jgi:type I restriction enzyme S subunit
VSVEWIEITLDEVCVKITDGAHHSPKSVDVGFPMSSVKDMTPFGLKLKSSRKISKEDFEKLVKQGCQPLKDDVLIAKDGNSALDTVCRVKETEEVVLLSSVAILRPDCDVIYPDFLRLYLDAEPTRNYLKSSSISGAAIPRVILKDFKRAKICLPRKLQEQKKIAHTISAYDNLIENNNRRIAILEDMAQSLYREWFVKFRFPGHEGCQFKDSALGSIPEGWEVGTVGHLYSVKSGFAFKSKEMTEEESDYAVIKIRNINEVGLDINNIQYISKDDVGEKALKFKPDSVTLQYRRVIP